jgi:hypothetical protein
MLKAGRADKHTTVGTEPALELRCGGAAVLTVGMAARSGRLTLRLGGGAAAESAYDRGDFTSRVRIQEQESAGAGSARAQLPGTQLGRTHRAATFT